jgi:hypothetical protein
MRTPKEFWPLLHLAQVRFEAGGATHSARLDKAMQDFSRLSVATRRDMLREMRALVTTLNELEPLALIEALTDKEEPAAVVALDVPQKPSTPIQPALDR